MSATTAPALPENAPFSPSQRAWLNGFFAGLLGRTNGPAAAALPVESAAVAAPEVEEEFAWHDAALPMDDRMKLADGKPFNRQLMAAMAQLDCGACGYLCKTYSEAIADGSEKDLTKCSPGGRETNKKLKELLVKGMGETNGKLIPPADVAIKRATAPSGKFDRQHPFPARLLKNEKLNADGSAKDTRLICLDLKGSGLDYVVGDSLGVYPENCLDSVEWILDAMDCSGAEDVPGTDGAPTSLLEALHRQRTITKPSDELLQLLADSATDNSEEADLRAMVKGDGAPPGSEVLDLFVKYPSARPSPEALVEALSPIAPRLYSIASSRAAHPNEVHLTVGVVRYLNCHGRQCKGVASTFFADRMKPGMKARVFLQTSHGFRLPSDASTPVIMVGPGTGIAPFRAFLQKRAAGGGGGQTRGKNWLFFGDQHEATDFLYRDELGEYQKNGVLTRLDTAFSRDGDAKLYVQHRMEEFGAELWSWLQGGACFYVCGDAKRMAKDVDSGLKAVVARHGGMSDEAAAGYVAEMAKNKRYLRDVY